MGPGFAAFGSWLRQQRHRDDPIGDLARDFIDDQGRRRRLGLGPAKSIRGLRFIVKPSSRPWAGAALEEALSEWRTARRKYRERVRDSIQAQIVGPRHAYVQPRTVARALGLRSDSIHDFEKRMGIGRLTPGKLASRDAVMAVLPAIVAADDARWAASDAEPKSRSLRP